MIVGAPGWWIKPTLIASVVLVLASAYGVQMWRIGRLETKLAASQHGERTAVQRAQAAEIAASAADQERIKERQHANAAQTAADKAAIALEVERVARLHADAGAAGLRDSAARAAAACRRPVPADPAAAARDAAAPDPGLVFANVLGRLESRGRELAALAGQRGAAGTACNAERAALTTSDRAGAAEMVVVGPATGSGGE